MVWTSFYGNVGKLLKMGVQRSDLVGISRYECRGFTDIKYDFQLAPSLSLLWDLKGNVIDFKEYSYRYYNQLYNLDYRYLENFVNLYDGKFLLCFEKNFQDCHRNLLRKFINYYVGKEVVREFF